MKIWGNPLFHAWFCYVYPSKNAPSDRPAILMVSVCGQRPPDLSLKAIGQLRQRSIERVEQKKELYAEHKLNRVNFSHCTNSS